MFSQNVSLKTLTSWLEFKFKLNVKDLNMVCTSYVCNDATSWNVKTAVF